MKHVGMSRSATPATRTEAMPHGKAPKESPFAKLPIGTAIATLRERLRTVAVGCERLRNVWRTQLNPHTPKVKREPLLCIREKIQEQETSDDCDVKEMFLQHGWCHSTFYRHILVLVQTMRRSFLKLPPPAWLGTTRIQ